MQVIYDIIVCAVGETTATFGVPGVMEHCYFMKASFLTPPDSHSGLFSLQSYIMRRQHHSSQTPMLSKPGNVMQSSWDTVKPYASQAAASCVETAMAGYAQEVTDTVGLRRRIGESFELAALPGTTEEDRKKALHFCVVGGGPTGGCA